MSAGDRLKKFSAVEAEALSAMDPSLATLRRLLRQPPPTAETVAESLHECARAATEALDADLALVAVWRSESGGWEAFTSGGDRIPNDGLSLVASRTILDHVRDGGEALATQAKLNPVLRSKSASRHEIHAVAAVPLRSRDPARSSLESRSFVGCLYADRRGDQRPFTGVEVELAIDIAHLAEVTLDLVRRAELAKEEARVAAAEARLTREVAEADWTSEAIESLDEEFERSVLTPLRRVASAQKVGLLFEGPTGSGKTHLARMFHYLSPRRAKPFIVLDCGQVASAEALAAELFGYAPKSGFSAPPEGRPGKARLADRGTLLVDEINSLPLELQPRLLRVIETGRFSRLGAAEEEVVDLQVVAASSQELRELMRRGDFRQDLYFRLAELTLELPPLDRRPSDIPRLTEAFLEKARRRFGRPGLVLSAEAVAGLRRFSWSAAGNIRGLEHAVNRTVLLAASDARTLGPGDLALPAVRGQRGSNASPAGGIGSLLARKIDQHLGNIARIAADAEVAAALDSASSAPPSTIRALISRHGLSEALERAREDGVLKLEDAVAAIRRHGSGAAAARALGVTRDQVAWLLRKNGLTVREVRAGEPYPSD